MKLKSILFGGFGILLLAGPAYAHHSLATFDKNKTLELQATIKDFLWASPHSWVDVMIPKADGVAELWRLECGAPGTLTRAGWTKDSLKAGDKVSLTIHPLRGGRTGGGICLSFTLPDGRKLTQPDLIVDFTLTKSQDELAKEEAAKKNATAPSEQPSK